MVNDRIQSLLTNELNVLKAGPIFNDCVQIIDQTREHFEISHHTLPNKTTPFITKAEESFGT